MKQAPASAYQQDLAYIHDVGYGDFARNSAPQLLELLAQAGVDEGLVVDLGCGSGIWAAALSKAEALAPSTPTDPPAKRSKAMGSAE